MEQFKVGDKVRILDLPKEGKPFIGQTATVTPSGGIGREDDDLVIRTTSGVMFAVKTHQLENLVPEDGK